MKNVDLSKLRVKCAAIRHKGIVYEGVRHCDIGLKMLEDGVCERPYPSRLHQGFVTECGRYIHRAIALKIAIQNDQLRKDVSPHKRHLFSEYLK